MRIPTADEKSFVEMGKSMENIMKRNFCRFLKAYYRQFIGDVSWSIVDSHDEPRDEIYKNYETSQCKKGVRCELMHSEKLEK